MNHIACTEGGIVIIAEATTYLLCISSYIYRVANNLENMENLENSGQFETFSKS